MGAGVVPRKCHNYEAQPSRGTKRRRDEKQIMTETNAKYEPQPLQQINLLGTSSYIQADEAPNYKHMFGPHRGSPSHQQNITNKYIHTYIITNTVMEQSEGFNGNLKPHTHTHTHTHTRLA